MIIVLIFISKLRFSFWHVIFEKKTILHLPYAIVNRQIMHMIFNTSYYILTIFQSSFMSNCSLDRSSLLLKFSETFERPRLLNRKCAQYIFQLDCSNTEQHPAFKDDLKGKWALTLARGNSVRNLWIIF